MAPSLQTAALSTLKFPVKCPMDWPIPKLADVLRARRLIPPYLPVTPAIEPARLTLTLRYRAVLKCENLNLTGAFKVRGGINLLGSRNPAVRARRVVSALTGNHG
jgi:threonine dehydratase